MAAITPMAISLPLPFLSGLPPMVEGTPTADDTPHEVGLTAPSVKYLASCACVPQ